MSTPRFLADEDLRNRIIQTARRLEPALEIIRVVDAGLQSSTDESVLDYATTNGLLVVSHDESTMKPLAENRIRTGRGVAGLFIVPQNRPPRMIAVSLVLIWSASQSEDWRDQIIYLPF